MSQAEVRRRQTQAISAVLALITFAVVAHLAGYSGAAYVAAAAEAYTLLCILISGGVSAALARILRVRETKGQYRNAAVMRRNAFLIQAVLGLLGSVVLLIGAEKIAVGIFRVQYSSAILMILAPAVLLRSLSSLFAGYSRGAGAELPSAAAGILRQLFILGFSVLFSRMLGEYGGKVSHLLAHENFTFMYGGIGAAIAVTLAEVLAAVFLLLVYQFGGRRRSRGMQEGMRATDSFFDSLRILFKNRAAQAGLLLLAVLPAPLGMIFWQKASGGEGAAEYGVYIAGYGVICGIAVCLVMLFLFPICASTVGFLRKDEPRFARSAFQSGVHIGVVNGAFLSVFAAMMSSQLGEAFCREQSSLAAKQLGGGSSIVVLAVLSLYFARILIITGKRHLVIGAVAVSDVVFVVADTVFFSSGKAGILSLVYAGLMASGVLCIALGMFAYRAFRLKPDWIYVLAVPMAAALLAGFAGMLLGKVLTPHLGSLVTVIVCLVISVTLYWTGLLLLRNFKEQELETMPGGGIFIALGQMLRVF